MTCVPLTQCCRLLAIDSKTLRQWRVDASLSLHSHPTDARIKCLTMEQVQHLATVYGRCIKLDAVASAPLCPETPRSLQPVGDRASVKTLDPLVPDPDLIGKLSHLEATVATLQQQLTQLALELLHERERHLQTFEAFIQQSGQQAYPREIQTTLAQASLLDAPKSQGRLPHPAELRARSRVLPLIEYGADGSYVTIDPLEGELQLVPDSAEWFEWLGSVSSFHFVGTLGRFSARRGGSAPYRHRFWYACRCIRRRDCKHYLGVTERLSLDRLEQAAAILQSRMP